MPGGYNGYIAVHDADYNLLGSIDYQSESKGGTVGVAMVDVKPEFRRRGLATMLYEELQKRFPDRTIHLDYTTDEGSEWAKSLKPK